MAPKTSEAAVTAEEIAEQRAALRQLWRLYSDRVLPVEESSFFDHFHAPPITVQEFESRPQVLLLGQYSTGKTSMIRWLTGSDSTHFDVRPQPSTDKFMAVVHGDEEHLIRGNAATCLPQLPYQGLSAFGANFLNSFQALVLNCDILKEITFIDTPGVLSGSKQRYGRAYDFSTIAGWMAERADLVLLTFDAHKLDISDEFQQVLQVLLPHTDKVRCVLNKADQIDATNLVRVYGALLWNVGKVLKTPEVARVFVSSFWEEAYRFQDHTQLFDEDKEALLKDLRALPRTSLLAKLNSFVARVRRVRAHMCVVAHLQSQLPWRLRLLRSEERARRWLQSNLPRLLEEAQLTRGVSAGDMPSLEAFQEKLASFDSVLQLPAWDPQEMARLERVVNVDVPQLMNQCQVGGVSVAPMTCRELPSPRQGLLRRLGITGGSNRKRKRDG